MDYLSENSTSQNQILWIHLNHLTSFADIQGLNFQQTKVQFQNLQKSGVFQEQV